MLRTLDDHQNPSASSPEVGPEASSQLNAQALPGRPLRVALVIDRLRAAGTERQVVQLIEHLDRRLVEPALCLLDGTDELSRLLEPHNVPILRLGVTRLRSGKAFSAAVTFRRWLSQQRIDLVQTYFPDSTFFAALVAGLTRHGRVIATRRNLGYWMQSSDLRRARWIGRLTRGTLANCDACRQRVLTDEGVSLERVAVLPNGIDPTPFANTQVLSRHELVDSPVVGMVANLRPVKRVDRLLDAAAELATEFPRLQYRIAGTGPLEEEIRARIDHLGLQHQIKLGGSQNDIPAFLGGSHIAVLCSDSEGSSNALMEYMAAGRAIVATDVGGNSELIEHERSGLLVPAGDSQALAAAIRRLLNEPALAETLAAHARERLAGQFAWPIVAQQYARFFHSVWNGATVQAAAEAAVFARKEASG